MNKTPQALLANSCEILSAQEVEDGLVRLSKAVTEDLSEAFPLVIAVMGGAVVFAGKLLPMLPFPLTFDFVQLSRYHNQTQGKELIWGVEPRENVIGRNVLLLDDILDEGHTLKALKEKCLALGAQSVKIAVLAEKQLPHLKPIKADYVALTVPNRYVFGCGMDVYGWWRNLPAIYALNEA